jgi:hypothetical protein
MRLDSSGTLGLGVTPSSWNLLKGFDISSGGALWGYAAQVGIGSNVYYGTSGFTYKTTNVASALQLDGNVFKFLTAASGTAGNAITFTQAMTLDASGNLLVGTASTSSLAASGRGLIEVNGSSDSAFAMKANNTLYGYLYNSSSEFRVANVTANPITFFTNNTERARIDSSGNLGLGVTPSAWSGISGAAFEIKGNAYQYSTTGVMSIGANAYFNGTNWIYKTTQAVTRYEQVNGQHQWSYAASGTAGNAITFTQAMTLDSSGSLGIGITNPAYKLVVSNAGAAGIEFSPTGGINSGGFIQGYNRSSSAFIDMTTYATAHHWTINSTEKMTLDASGNLLVGTTTSGNKLYVAGGASTPVSAVTFSATAMTVNCYLSNVFTTTFTANVTTAPTLSNPSDGQTINWFITQDGTGSRTMTWPTSFKWAGGTAGTLSTAANSVDLLVATYRSATGFWYASLSKAFS